jgi:tetratricopeptide (TPR) repeat protein
MLKKQGIKSFILPLLILPSLFGCVSETRKVVEQPKAEIITTPPLSADIIDTKIASINNVLMSKSLDDEDRELAITLISAYKELKSVSQSHGTTTKGYHETVHILFNNLNLLAERYFVKERGDDQDYSEVIHLFSIKTKKILDDYLSGDYQGVINECVELEATFGPDSLSPEVGLIFALSLAKRDMVSDALKIGETIIRALEAKPDLIHLRAYLIEWQLDIGNREKALKFYEKLIDSLDEREALLSRVRQKFKREEKIVRREKTPPVDDSKRDEVQEPSTIERLLKEIDKLVRRDAFAEAKLLLIKQRLMAQEEPELETIDQALKTVQVAEERYQKRKITSVTHGEETLKLATKLIEEEKFEEAISKLEELKENQDLTYETKEIKELAIEKLINRERNRAAKIFLRAKKTNDPAKRKELLVSSHSILKVLIEEYPSSNLIDKLNRHIKSVENELNKMREE